MLVRNLLFLFKLVSPWRGGWGSRGGHSAAFWQKIMSYFQGAFSQNRSPTASNRKSGVNNLSYRLNQAGLSVTWPQSYFKKGSSMNVLLLLVIIINRIISKHFTFAAWSSLPGLALKLIITCISDLKNANIISNYPFKQIQTINSNCGVFILFASLLSCSLMSALLNLSQEEGTHLSLSSVIVLSIPLHIL